MGLCDSLEAGVNDYACGAAVVLYTEYYFLSAAASMHASHLDTGLGCKMTSQNDVELCSTAVQVNLHVQQTVQDLQQLGRARAICSTAEHSCAHALMMSHKTAAMASSQVLHAVLLMLEH